MENVLFFHLKYKTNIGKKIIILRTIWFLFPLDLHVQRLARMRVIFMENMIVTIQIQLFDLFMSLCFKYIWFALITQCLFIIIPFVAVFLKRTLPFLNFIINFVHCNISIGATYLRKKKPQDNYKQKLKSILWP